MVQEAQGYKASVVARAEGDARRFSLIVAEYVKSPGVTRDRLYIEAMERVFANTTKILVDQKGGGNILYLPLDKLIARGASGAGPVNTLLPLPEPAEAAAPGPGGAARDRQRDSQRSRGGQ